MHSNYSTIHNNIPIQLIIKINPYSLIKISCKIKYPPIRPYLKNPREIPIDLTKPILMDSGL